MSKAPKLVVVGSSNTDLVVNCDRLPQPGETVLGGTFGQYFGGKGANQAVAASRAGAEVIFVGACGYDEYGGKARAALKLEGVNLHYFRRLPGVPSGVAVIMVGGKRKENVIAVAGGANEELTVQMLEEAKGAIQKADAVVAQLESPPEVVAHAGALAREAEVPFLLNPAPADVELEPDRASAARRKPTRQAWKQFFQNVSCLTVNETEAELITGQKDPKKAVAALRGYFKLPAAVITLGKKGCLVSDEEGEKTVKAPRVEPLDTVGAGDCFHGWLATGIAEGMSLQEAAEHAVLAASIAVTRAGAQPGMPWRHEVVGE